MQKDIVLSISMLASRKREEVKRCLDSLAHLRSQIPCELILVDTSQDAEIHAMLLEYTNLVVEFTWCNDFSKARNAGLALAKGQWFLYIDDDEWFVDDEEIIDFFKSGKYKNYSCANYIQRNFHDAEGTYYSDSWVSRMIRLEKDTCFKSKIHEYLYPQTGEGINLHAIANHTGYINLSSEDQNRRFERNAPLLLEMIEEEPKRLRWRVQLIQEYQSVKKWKELAEFAQKTITDFPQVEDEWDKRDMGTVYAACVEALLNQNEYDEAICEGEKIIKNPAADETCRAYVFLLMGKAYYRMGQYEQAIDCIRQYFTLYELLLKNIRRMEIQQGALLVGAAFDEVPKKRAYSIWIMSALRQGDTSILNKYFEQLEWNQKVIYVADDMVEALLHAMATLPVEPVFITAMQCLWNNKELQSSLFSEIEGYKENTSAYHKLHEILSQIEGNHWYIYYVKILESNRKKVWDQMEGDFIRFCELIPNIYLLPSEIKDCVQKIPGLFERGILSVSFEQWMRDTCSYINQAPYGDLQITIQELLAMKTQENIRYDYALMQFAQADMFYSIKLKESENKKTAMSQFAAFATRYYRKYFQPQVMELYPELLPEEAQAAFLLEQAFEEGNKEQSEKLEFIRKAASVCPDFSAVIKSYLAAYKTETILAEVQRKSELHKLSEKIKKECVSCIKKKQYAQAFEILDQLKQLQPNDIEVADLRLRTRIAMLEED